MPKLQIDGLDIADIPHEVATQLKSVGPYGLNYIEYTPNSIGLEVSDYHLKTYRTYSEGTVAISLQYKEPTT